VPTSTFHWRVRFSGQARGSLNEASVPSRLGPRHCGQSSAFCADTTAVNPVIALELLAKGTWSGAGVLGPEAFDAQPFLDLLTEYGSPWGMKEIGV